MRMILLAIGVSLACGGAQAEPEEPADEATPVETTEPVVVETVSPEAEPTQDPDPGAEPRACAADEGHCCRDDGTIVRPGGCAPSYPSDAVPGLLRGDDGRCVRDERPCRVRCLPASARIATPSGGVPVGALRMGDRVFSLDAAGQRVVVPIVALGAVPVSSPHSLVEVRLDDGRRVRASAGHPVANGDELGVLRTGDVIDGGTVVSVAVLPYDGTHTHDLLPAGPTGVYWAEGVLLGSTLAP